MCWTHSDADHLPLSDMEHTPIYHPVALNEISFVVGMHGQILRKYGSPTQAKDSGSCKPIYASPGARVSSGIGLLLRLELFQATTSCSFAWFTRIRPNKKTNCATQAFILMSSRPLHSATAQPQLQRGFVSKIGY